MPVRPLSRMRWLYLTKARRWSVPRPVSPRSPTIISTADWPRPWRLGGPEPRPQRHRKTLRHCLVAPASLRRQQSAQLRPARSPARGRSGASCRPLDRGLEALQPRHRAGGGGRLTRISSGSPTSAPHFSASPTSSAGWPVGISPARGRPMTSGALRQRSPGSIANTRPCFRHAFTHGERDRADSRQSRYAPSGRELRHRGRTASLAHHRQWGEHRGRAHALDAGHPCPGRCRERSACWCWKAASFGSKPARRSTAAV